MKRSNTKPNYFKERFLYLVIFLGLAIFFLGRTSGINCGQSYPTKLGAIYVLRTNISPNANNDLFSRLIKPSSAAFQDQATQRVVLILPDNSTLTMLMDQNNKSLKTKKPINFSDYQNQRVFVTGKLDSCDNTFTISSQNDIQPLP